MTMHAIMRMGPVTPVVVIEHVSQTMPLAEGGINVIEITLRSDAALDCIAAIASQRPQMTVGAGTVLTPAQMQAAKDAGAAFAVSPRAYPYLIKASAASNLPLSPGAATASEMMALMAAGLIEINFSPAAVAGGVDYLRAVASPLANAVFCPTGGISVETAADRLALSNVACVSVIFAANLTIF